MNEPPKELYKWCEDNIVGLDGENY